MLTHMRPILKVCKPFTTTGPIKWGCKHVSLYFSQYVLKLLPDGIYTWYILSHDNNYTFISNIWDNSWLSLLPSLAPSLVPSPFLFLFPSLQKDIKRYYKHRLNWWQPISQEASEQNLLWLPLILGFHNNENKCCLSHSLLIYSSPCKLKWKWQIDSMD